MNDFKGIIEDVEKSSLVSDKVIEKVIEIIGQEKWQDINDEKSDICTTTGELIISLKGIPELEKENAELKKKIGIYQKGMFDEIEKRDKKVIKATELFELFIQWSYGCCKEPDYKNLVKQAEQFIKEIEK